MMIELPMVMRDRQMVEDRKKHLLHATMLRLKTIEYRCL
jgi:hypothetical protein